MDTDIGLVAAIPYQCVSCPTGVLCDSPGVTENTLQTAAGYWRSSVNSTDFIKCLRTSNCVAGVIGCAASTHRTGPLCAVRVPSFVMPFLCYLSN
jgi:hypothetical protein